MLNLIRRLLAKVRKSAPPPMPDPYALAPTPAQTRDPGYWAKRDRHTRRARDSHKAADGFAVPRSWPL